MDLGKEEIKVVLEALGQRYKSLRAHPPKSSTSPSDRTAFEDNIKLIDMTIKKLLSYKEENFPEELKEENPEESDSALDSEEEKDYSGLQLLLVDNDNSDRNKIRTLLTETGFENFDESDDGHNAIAQIKDKAKPYDLVLCDLNMPTISGLDVLKLVRQEEKYANMPFILLSKKGNKKQFEDAVEAGVNAYIVKPITPDNLIPKIDLLLS